MNNTKIFAHRGYRARYPENTLLAYKEALKTGCYGIELDVQLSKDGEVVILHDETLDRTTNGSGYVNNHTLSDLKKLDAGRGEKIPTLTEYFELVKDSDIVTNIELKNSVVAYEELEEKVISIVRGFECAPGGVIISSFSFPSVRKVKALAPDIPAALIAWMFCEPDNLVRIMREHGVDYIHPSSQLYWKSLSDSVASVVLDSFPANVWTAGDEWEVRKLAESGVNGIFTDDPGFLSSIL